MSKILTPFERSLKEKMNDYELPYEQRSWFQLQRQMSSVNASHYPWVVALLATIMVTAASSVVVYRHRHVPSAAVAASMNERFEKTISILQNNQSSENPSYLEENTPEQQVNQENSNQYFNNLLASSNETSRGESDSYNAGQSNQDATLASSTDSNTGTQSTVINESVKKATPKPEDMIAFDAPVRRACVGEEVEFVVTQGPNSDDGYLWDFGDNHFDKDKRMPKHKFMKSGTYDVALSVTNSKGQITTVVSNDLITIIDSPDAQFSWEFVNTDPAKPAIKIVDNSENASSYRWNLADGVASSEKNPTFQLKQNGKQNISLHVLNEYGCTDIVVKQVSVNSDFKLDAPQVIRIGSDNFMPKGLKDNKVKFVMSIVDQNGNQVYQTSNRLKGWDGKLPNGTYATPGDSFKWKVIIENDLTKEQKYFNGTFNVSP